MADWVTFDFDNTLVRSPYWRLHLQPWLDREAATQGTTWRHLWALMRARGDTLWRQGYWVESFDWPHLASQVGLSPLPDPRRPPQKLLRPLVIPWAEGAITAVLQQNLRLGLVTNGFIRFQKPYLEALGWDFLFESLVGPDITGTAKPNPGIMQSFWPGLAHVGDRLTHDVLVAQRTERHAVLVGIPVPEADRIDPLGPRIIQPDYQMASLRAWPALLSQLVQSPLTRESGHGHRTQTEPL